MKKLLIFMIALQSSIGYAQNCIRTAPFQNGPDYTVSGTARLELRDDTLTLYLSDDFSTVSGPDLHLYLSDTPRPDAQSFILAPLKSSSGAQSYLVPSHITIDRYPYILIHCKAFNHFWGHGAFGSITGDCSVATGMQALPSAVPNVLPNPVKNKLFLTSTTEIISLKIRSVDGKAMKVTSLERSGNDITVDVSDLTPGLYFLETIGANGSMSVNKIIVAY